ncbi:hypothetical protein L6452_28681 [Arctium lappa]|uniref:Uncharacterized protein n=1 Tax=Arctium lappa TaxID=4217 RepID=A0ACB8ZZC6_ARCLA|nr:hypothetical protein L6452_28681 [Arctium lappa]
MVLDNMEGLDVIFNVVGEKFDEHDIDVTVMEPKVFKASQERSLYSTPEPENCNRYAICGSFAFASCNITNFPACGCLEGFEPTSPNQWKAAVWSQGCRRSTPLNCGPRDGFRKYSSLKLPDTQESWFNQSMNLDECEMVCKKNCNCTAYTTQNIQEPEVDA